MHCSKVLVYATEEVPPSIHAFFDNSDKEKKSNLATPTKQPKLTRKWGLTPPDTDVPNEQGPSQKRRKLVPAQNVVQVDSSTSIKQGLSSRKRSRKRKLVDEQDVSSADTDAQKEQGRIPRRQKLAHEHSLTPPDTDTFEKGLEPAKSSLKQHIEIGRLKKHARSVEEGSDSFFTLARVDINVVFPISDTQISVASDEEQKYKKGIPVLLKSYSKTPDGLFACRVKRLDCDDAFEFEGLTNLPPETADILRHVIKVAALRRGSHFSSICWLSKALWPTEGAVDEEWRLCCKILVRNATSLSGQLPIKPKNLFDLYAFKDPSSTFDPWSPREFYENVCVPRKVDDPAGNETLRPLMSELKCELYPFQERAVRWLLRREGHGTAGEEIPNLGAQNTTRKLPHGFIQTADADGKQWAVSRCLSIATTNKELLEDYSAQIKGGILCEEMGLGKTVEMIALMCLHRRKTDSTSQRVHKSTEGSLVRSPATLIITPPAILRQWESELQNIAPHLKVMVYEGVRTERKALDNEQLIARLVDQDVILTTYNVLAREVYYTAGAVQIRNMRYNKVYERKKSPLTQTMWWRVVLDEAQMVESGVSNAAKVAQVIPREHAWAVTGTPVKRDSQDLLGLLIFLRFEPYCVSVKLWNRMIQHHRDVFHGIFRTIALRHTKDQIRDELQLPSQTRVIINVPFTQIEEQHYSTMYQEMCRDCGLDLNGSPLTGDWDPTTMPAIVEKMRIWLARLRQTCLHPEVGGRNRRALGANKAPLRTVDEVLDVMTEQNDTASRAEEKDLLNARLKRGQVLENVNQIHRALQIWKDVLIKAKHIVKDDRMQLKSAGAQPGSTGELANLEEDLDVENSAASRIGVYRNRLRSSLEIEHVSTFFIANAYYQIKTDHTMPNSDAYRELEKLEESTYELAKSLRQEILGEAIRTANGQMEKIRTKSSGREIVEVPEIKQVQGKGGIESRDILSRVRDLCSAINSQASQLIQWREKLLEHLLLPLLDNEEKDLQGDEYDKSIKQQDEVYVYMDALRATVSDRHDFMTGQTNTRIDNEMKAAIREAEKGEGHAPQLTKSLMHIREKLKPSPNTGSLRGVITEVRELKATLRAQVDRGSTRAEAEFMIVNDALSTLQAIYNKQTKVLTSLDRELELFKTSVDSRLEYYRQLQQISDRVIPYENEKEKMMNEQEFKDRIIAPLETNEAEISGSLARRKAEGRYLIHLRAEATSQETQRQCIICREHFERGVLTSCGHCYCTECLQHWTKSHRNCPTCKKPLTKNDFHQITFKPRELTVQEELDSNGAAPVTNGDSKSIYSGVTATTLNQIKNIDLNGSYGTKIDTLARHILWIREKDPGAKAVIFSQFKDFLDVLGKAFTQFGIAWTSFDKLNGVRNFKSDASIECFFLHAKAQSSGLNLVNATHVFLCEPLINTAIELQAIARVHRIGQHQPTTVWMYLVEDTVEKSIYEISVARRISLISHAATSEPESSDKSDVTEHQLDAANTLELQQASLSRMLAKNPGGGEMVGQEDLWNCLFRKRPEKLRQTEAETDAVVARNLRAAAAERRQETLQDVAMEGML